MIRVIDASVAFKWLVREPGSDEAEAVLDSGDLLHAPDLLLAEVANALTMAVNRGDLASLEAEHLIRMVPRMLQVLVPSRDLAARAIAIAAALRHPAYDCFYLALAERLDTAMISDDARLRRCIAGTEWANRVIPLVP